MTVPAASRCPRCLALLPVTLPGDAAPESCPFCQASLPRAGDPLAGTSRQFEAGQNALREVRNQWKAQQRAERAAMRERFQKELFDEGLLRDAEASLAIVVPRFDGEMSPLPDDRKARFLSRLDKLAAEVFSGKPTAAYVPTGDDDPPVEDTAATVFERAPGAACALCRGYCCSHGGEHAFLDIDTLRWRTEQNGLKSAAEVVEAYRELLPAHTIGDSCVFHTDTGCAMPRAMRSFTCNDFICSGLDDFQQLAPDPAVLEIGIVAQHNGERVRAAIVRESEGGAV